MNKGRKAHLKSVSAQPHNQRERAAYAKSVLDAFDALEADKRRSTKDQAADVRRKAKDQL